MFDDIVAALGSPHASQQVMANLPAGTCGVSSFQGGVSYKLEDAGVSKQSNVSPSLPEAMAGNKIETFLCLSYFCYCYLICHNFILLYPVKTYMPLDTLLCRWW